LQNDHIIKIYLKRVKNLSGLLNKVSSKYKITSVKSEHISLHDIFIDKIKNDYLNRDEHHQS